MVKRSRCTHFKRPFVNLVYACAVGGGGPGGGEDGEGLAAAAVGGGGLQ